MVSLIGVTCYTLYISDELLGHPQLHGKLCGISSLGPTCFGRCDGCLAISITGVFRPVWQL